MRVKAHISVIAAISITLILSLVLACYKSAYDFTLNTYIKQACCLSTEAVFSSYDNDILDQFNVFVLKKTDKVDRKLNAYIEDNISNADDIELLSSTIDTFEMATDNGGAVLRDEIVQYMRYGVYSEAVDYFLNSKEQVDKANKVNEITSDIVECEEEICRMDEKILKLIELVEGIKTSDAGIVIKNGKPVSSNSSFVKMVINDAINKDNTNVDNDKVYKAVSESSPGYVNIETILQDIIDDTDGLYEIGDEESDMSGNNSYAEIYARNYKKLADSIEQSLSKIDEALDVIDEYEASKSCAAYKLSQCKKNVLNNKDLLGEELAESLQTDLDDIDTDTKSDKKTMCDVDEIRKALKRNKVILSDALPYLEKLDVKLEKNNCKEVRVIANNLKDALVGINNTGLKFDYSKIDFSSELLGLKVVKKLKNTIEDGIFALVIDADKVSDKSINISDLAISEESEYVSSQSDEQELLDTLLLDEYILMKFNSFSDCADEEYDDSGKLLDYMVEYTLYGKTSDKENLKQAAIELSAIRTGFNLAYILTDTQKKNEALTLATSLLGFTGNTALIKSGQYLILSVWAYAEAVMDIKRLLAGQKVPLTKTKQEWRLSLQNLLTLKLDDDKESKTGLIYEEYIRALLLLENSTKKNYRIMSAMELWMIENNHKDFRMKDYIVSVQGQAVFKCKTRKSYYSQKISYSY